LTFPLHSDTVRGLSNVNNMQSHQYKITRQQREDLPKSIMDQTLSVIRTEKSAAGFPELKDPTVIKHPSGFYVMYASIGNSFTQQWKVGRFVSTRPTGSWTELSPVQFEGI